jgi:hypothetical protein
MSIEEFSAPSQVPVNAGKQRGGQQRAMDADRLIGAAVGITMVRHELPYDEALDLLRGLSKHYGRRLDALARDVVMTGTTAAVGTPFLVRYTEGRVYVTAPGGGVPTSGLVNQRRVEHLARPLNDSVPARILDLLVETTDLSELLGGVAEMAVETVPGCDSASVTLIHHGEPATIAASDLRARQIDQVQYDDGHGPCMLAAATDDVIQVDDVSATPPEQAWGRVAADAGITAAISLPIASAGNIAAALNLYTTRVTGWPTRAVLAGETLAAYIGDAITLAYRINRRDPGGLYYWPHLT